MKSSIGSENVTGENTTQRAGLREFLVVLVILLANGPLMGQMGTPSPLPAAEREKAEAERKATGPIPDYPQLVDITASTGIHFDHLSSPEAKFIAESMSGGIALIDYDRQELRSKHFPSLQTPAFFVHGARDGFGSPEEVEAARKLIPAPTKLILVAGAGHELMTSRNREELTRQIVPAFLSFADCAIAPA